MTATAHDGAMATDDDLRQIRVLCERVLRANPDDTEVDLVRRMARLAWPESAAGRWFDRWQIAYQMNTRLREVLGDLLNRLDRGEALPAEVTTEAWAVLGDVQALIPEPPPGASAQEPS